MSAILTCCKKLLYIIRSKGWDVFLLDTRKLETLSYRLRYDLLFLQPMTESEGTHTVEMDSAILVYLSSLIRSLLQMAHPTTKMSDLQATCFKNTMLYAQPLHKRTHITAIISDGVLTLIVNLMKF